MKRQVVLSNWRDDLSEYVNLNNVTPKNAKTDTRAKEKVEEKDVKNKVVINPTMSEAFEELGGIIISVTEELSKEQMEELQRKKDEEAGRKPGKVEEGSNPESQLADIDKRIAMQRLKRARVEKQQAKKNQGQNTEMQERTMTPDEKAKEDRLKDKYDDSSMKDNMKKQYGDKEGKKVYFATIRKQAMESAALDYMRSKYKDSLITPSSKPKAPSKKELDRRAANRAANQKSGPMAQDPYKSRAGESD